MAMLSNVVMSLQASNNRDSSLANSEPTFPLGTSNRLRFQWIAASYASSILEEKKLPLNSPRLKLVAQSGVKDGIDGISLTVFREELSTISLGSSVSTSGLMSGLSSFLADPTRGDGTVDIHIH